MHKPRKAQVCPACHATVMKSAYCNLKSPAGVGGWKTPDQRWVSIGWFCTNCAHFIPRWKSEEPEEEEDIPPE